jgi:hypothetical protein
MAGLLLAAALLAAAVSCGFKVDSGQVACGDRAECPPEFECRFDGFCYRIGIGLSTSCGNGKIDRNETCDPPGSCPEVCDDGNSCTLDNRVGQPENCNVACLRTVIRTCVAGDGCCPEGCSPASDSDCSTSCGNGEIDRNETCDPPDSCPEVCDDGDFCTADLRTGSAANCNVACSATNIGVCIDDDDCCPAACDATTDNDCSTTCGNGIREPGETCDPPETCPVSCDDGFACTVDSRSGSAQNCNVTCTHTVIVSCSEISDGCCPGAACIVTDPDCEDPCDDDLICDAPDESAELCPADCFGCGDQFCNPLTENVLTCPGDCTAVSPCGNGVCEPPTEDSDNCGADCTCGDAVCDGAEVKKGTCPIDCSAITKDGGVTDASPLSKDGGF